MSIDHTVLPEWYIEKADNHFYIVEKRWMEDMPEILIIRGTLLYNQEDEQEQQIAADLMCAAPELVDVLECLLSNIEQTPPSYEAIGEIETERAEALLKKIDANKTPLKERLAKFKEEQETRRIGGWEECLGGCGQPVQLVFANRYCSPKCEQLMEGLGDFLCEWPGCPERGNVNDLRVRNYYNLETRQYTWRCEKHKPQGETE